MLNIPQNKLMAAVDAMNLAGLIIEASKLANAIPDKKYRCATQEKPRGLNGWYVLKYDSALDFVTIVYGNWEHGENASKYHINLKSHDQPIRTNQERQKLQAQIDAKIASDRAKQAQERDRNAAYYSAEFNRLPLCSAHPYTDRKGINEIYHLQLHQDTRFNKNLLCIQFYDDRGVIRGYQTIAPDGTKLFNGSVGGCFWQHPMVNPLPEVFTKANSFYIIGEGLATVLSAYQAITHGFGAGVFMPYMLVAFNCGNLDKVIKATQAQGLPYLLLVDNDRAKKRNAGFEAARRLINDNPSTPIYPLAFPNGDANDFIMEFGESAFIDLLCKYAAPITSYIKRA